VVNAIVDALRPYGIHDVRMPCSPERIWRTLHGTDTGTDTGPGTSGTAPVPGSPRTPAEEGGLA
jgi:carbon-monoxide dehydrogenase large subunit